MLSNAVRRLQNSKDMHKQYHLVNNWRLSNGQIYYPTQKTSLPGIITENILAQSRETLLLFVVLSDGKTEILTFVS